MGGGENFAGTREKSCLYTFQTISAITDPKLSELFIRLLN